MRIFDLILQLEKNLKQHELGCSAEYISGYITGLEDLRNRIEDSVEVSIK